LLKVAPVLGSSGSAYAAQAKSDPYADVLKDPGFPEKFPFGEKEMGRYDESSDFIFYSQPRFVTHIDDAAIGALTKYYAREFPPAGDNVAILDVCSSWISHYPEGYKAGKISGLGMNEDELKRNPILTDYTVRDLNEDPSFPYEDNTFDVVTNTVSVDYLTKPLEVMKEVNRVLKPGGLAIMSFSNRCFPTKAVAIWTATGDLDHVWIVGSYYHFAGGFDAPSAEDISPNPGKTDPMFVVTARKSTA
jgi:SAM-dependent methyltransferase